MHVRTIRRFFLMTTTVATLLAIAIPAAAASISITAGNPGNQGTDNVLFNDPLLLHLGTVVEGNFAANTPGSGFVVEFTSSSGSQLIEGTGGQASIEGLAGNDPFKQLAFELQGGATFTNAILNIDADADGQVQFIVTYTGGDNASPLMQVVNVVGNGQNFFGFEATGGAEIVSISIVGLGGVDFLDVAQIRLGGFADVAQLPIPEPATLLMLGSAAAIGLGRIRRRS